jgi:hypothetical protein
MHMSECYAISLSICKKCNYKGSNHCPQIITQIQNVCFINLKNLHLGDKIDKLSWKSNQ